MAERLGDIMGCSFRPGYHREETAARTAELLGMDVYLYEWRGLGDRRIYRFHGDIGRGKYAPYAETEGVEYLRIDISEAIIDLLAAHGGGEWHRPTEADIAAEIAYGSRILRSE
ncbi:hypothetical protein [Streptomyces sp. 11x1]|uniref:hypothetical protein n=1 Tax=Streptomyces sp. 11x1 TaxID=3038642 RepID=UPI00292D4196|nr:hypothetical protein [Streptomyces sp. 11x1]WNZ08075.1 hypothetical protein P8T65_11070 [Streptomyces sp. 11x1]